jgi:hypothetical protein
VPPVGALIEKVGQNVVDRSALTSVAGAGETVEFCAGARKMASGGVILVKQACVGAILKHRETYRVFHVVSDVPLVVVGQSYPPLGKMRPVS